MNNERKNFLERIWEYKIPQYLGTYLAIGFGLIQFFDFASKRYDIVESVIDRFLIVWVALIPALFVFLYFGYQLEPKKAFRNLKWPKYFILINVIAAFVFAGLYNKESKNSHQIVQITDEEGQQITAIVPELRRIKTIACFQFENQRKDTTEHWMSMAMSELLSYSLEQRPEFYVESAFNLTGYYDGVGIKPFTNPSSAILRTIAKKSRNDYYTKITYLKEDKKIRLKGKLYRTKDNKVIKEIEIIGNTVFEAIDLVQDLIFSELSDTKLIDGTYKNQLVLPSSSLISNNLKALENFAKSKISILKEPHNLQKSIDFLEQSIEEDKSCSLCYLWKGSSEFSMRKKAEATQNFKKAIKYGISLPMRMQFSAKQSFYGATNNIDALLKLKESQRQMYPYEFESYKMLLPFYVTNYGIEKAKKLVQEAIDNGNLEKGLLSLFSLQIKNEEYDEAKKTLDRFTKEFPERDQDRLKYATLYEKQGKLKKAKQKLLEEENLDPFNTQIKKKLALIEFRSGNVTEAKQKLNNELRLASTLTDSLMYLQTKMNILMKSGEIKNALKTYDLYVKSASKVITEINILQTNYTKLIDAYQSINQVEKAKNIISKLSSFVPDNKDLFNCIYKANAIINNYDSFHQIDTLTCGKSFAAYGDGYVDFFELMSAYNQKDYKTCIEILEKDRGRIVKLFNQRYFIADIYNMKGDSEKAEEILSTALKEKTDSPIHYYKMAVLIEKKNTKKAKEYLKKAFVFWKNADEDYIPLQRAIVLKKRIDSQPEFSSN